MKAKAILLLEECTWIYVTGNQNARKPIPGYRKATRSYLTSELNYLLLELKSKHIRSQCKSNVAVNFIAESNISCLRPCEFEKLVGAKMNSLALSAALRNFIRVPE
eukprot:3124175-Pleurochrysis_carterae.AAC.1